MTTFKRMHNTVVEKNEDQHMSKRIQLNFNTRRDVWNGRRRFCY